MKKKMIIILIVIISILCIICLGILKILDKEEGNTVNNDIVEVQDTLRPDETVQEEYSIEKERNATRFFTVQDCIQTYIDSINNSDAQAILNKLSTTYKEDNSIHESNISNLINLYNGNTFTAKEMEILRGDRIFQYRVYGYLTNDQGRQYMYLKVKTDRINRTFEIEPFIGEQYTSLEDIPLEEANIDEIAKNDNNTFSYRDISKEEISRIYQRYYTNLEIERPEEAYEMLDVSYRQERFPTIDDFKMYVEENREAIEQASLSGYSVNNEDNITKFVIRDSNIYQYIYVV